MRKIREGLFEVRLRFPSCLPDSGHGTVLHVTDSTCGRYFLLICDETITLLLLAQSTDYGAEWLI